MKELTITKETIGNEEINAVDARSLWLELGARKQFGNWIQNKVLNNPFFEENVDWEVIRRAVKNPQGGRPAVDYTLSLDTAIIVALKTDLPGASDVYMYLTKQKGKDVIIKHSKREEYYFGKEIINNLFSEYKILPQYSVLDGEYFIDWYIPELKLAIEFDETHHKYNVCQDKIRQARIEEHVGCKFIRYSV